MIGWHDAVFLAILVAALALLSSRLRLGLSSTLAWASIRAVLQLSLLALVLGEVLRSHNPWLAIGLLLVMTTIASQAALARVRMGHRGLPWISLVSLAAGNWMMVAFGILFLLRPSPWYEPSTLIPFAGILLGNSLSGVSLGLGHWLTRLQAQSDRIELLLSHGATRYEAAEDFLREALRSGLVPVLNSMTVAGLVSIPGLMVGQMLAGANPRDAARAQTLILILITAGTLLGTLLALGLSFRVLFNRRHQFLYSELSLPHAPRGGKEAKKPWVLFWKLRRFLALRS